VVREFVRLVIGIQRQFVFAPRRIEITLGNSLGDGIRTFLGCTLQTKENRRENRKKGSRHATLLLGQSLGSTDYIMILTDRNERAPTGAWPGHNCVVA